MSPSALVAVRVLAQVLRNRKLVGPLLLVPLVELYLLKIFLDAFAAGQGEFTGRFVLPMGAFLVHFIAYLLCLLALVRERLQGTMARMFVAGYRRLQVVLGYAIAYTALVAVLSAEVLLASVGFFSLAVTAPQLLGTFLVYWLLGMASLALGILISNFVESEGQVIPFIPLVVLPSVFLSGMLIPMGDLPSWAQALALLVPLRFAVPVIHSLTLADTGLTGRLGYLLALTASVFVILGLSVLTLPGDAGQERGGVRIRLAAAVTAAILVIGGAIYAWQSSRWIRTANAFVTGRMIRIGPLQPARVVGVSVHVGDAVRAGQVLAVLSEVGSPAYHYLVAPSAGSVIGRLAAGNTVVPGQPVVTMVSTARLWVEAYVPEGQALAIQVGQTASIHVDAWHRTIFGRVIGVVPATAATIEGIPPGSPTGVYTKVAQTLPVRIQPLLPPGTHLLPGLSVEVSIGPD